MIELPLLKHCLRGHFLMKLIIKVKMSNKRSELFKFFFFSAIAFLGSRYKTSHRHFSVLLFARNGINFEEHKQGG